MLPSAPTPNCKRTFPALAFARDRFHSLVEIRRGQIPALDGLRAIAITLVILGHSKYDFVAAAGNASPPFVFGALGLGWIGVDLFFVLSGFLIGRMLLEEFRRHHTIRVGAFLLRRGLRIWPLYFFICAVTLFGMAWGQRLPHWSALVPDFLLLTNYFGEKLAYGSWSLSVEEQFYIVVPLILLALGKRLNRRAAGASWLFASFFFLAPFIRHLTWLGAQRFSIAPSGVDSRLLHDSLFTHYDGLVVGLFLASIFVYTEPGASIRKRLGPLLGRLTVFVGSLAYFFPIAFRFSFLGLLFGTLVWAGLAERPTRMGRLLAWPGFQVLSRLSYGMYLWYRFPLWRIAHAVVGRNPFDSPFLDYLLIFGLTYIFAMVAATVTYVAIEAPFLALRNRLPAKEPFPGDGVAATLSGARPCGPFVLDWKSGDVMASTEVLNPQRHAVAPEAT